MHPSNASSPFGQVRAWGLLGWMVVGCPILLVATRVSAAMFRVDWRAPIMRLRGDLIAQVVPLLWAISILVRGKIDGGALFGRLPEKRRWFCWTGIVVGCSLFSLGCILTLFYPVSFVFPNFVTEVICRRDATAFLPSPEHLCLRALVVIGLVPVVEELVFRGIILHAWDARWGIRKAIWGSSLLFGALHAEPSAVFAGFVFAVLYVESQTLWVPIFCHALTNAFGILPCCLRFMTEHSAAYTAEDFRSGCLFGLVCFGTTAPWALYFCRKHWPSRDWRAPYSVRHSACDARPPGPCE